MLCPFAKSHGPRLTRRYQGLQTDWHSFYRRRRSLFESRIPALKDSWNTSASDVPARKRRRTRSTVQVESEDDQLDDWPEEGAEDTSGDYHEQNDGDDGDVTMVDPGADEGEDRRQTRSSDHKGKKYPRIVPIVGRPGQWARDRVNHLEGLLREWQKSGSGPLSHYLNDLQVEVSFIDAQSYIAATLEP